MDLQCTTLVQVMAIALVLTARRAASVDSCDAMDQFVTCSCYDYYCHGLAYQLNVSTLWNIFQSLPDSPMESVEIASISDSALPAHFNGNKQMRKISLQCDRLDEFQIDPLAFDDPTNYLKDFSIYWCPLRDLIFLQNMKALNVLHLDHVVHNLTQVNPSLDLNTALEGKDLRKFVCIQCGLETFPVVLSTMANLSTIDLGRNPIQRLAQDSVLVSSQVTVLNFTGCPISEVERNAFRGDFSNATIDLSFTKLKRLPVDSFQYLLMQMLQARGSGRLKLFGVILDCDCSLSWLLRNRALLKFIRG